MPGRVVGGRYELLELLGEGSIGRVYRARDRADGVEVGVKLLRRDRPDHLQRLKNEFRSLAGLFHPNLAQLYELHVDDDVAFLTLECLSAVPVTDYVRPNGRRDQGRLESSWPQLVSALDALHAAGRLHRDIKPHNVLVEATGRLVVLDFDLVELDGRPGQGGFAGTVAYMAPEILRGEPATVGSDAYSLGVVLYECLNGRLPYGPETLARPFDDRPPPAAFDADLPSEWVDLALGLLDPDPRIRVRHLMASHDRDRGSRTAAPGARGSRFVGREVELRALRVALSESRRGPVVVQLLGPSGIGKSAVVDVFAESPGDHETEPVILRARCRTQETVRFNAIDGLVDEWVESARRSGDGPLIDDSELAAVAGLFPVVRGLASDLPPPPISEPRELRKLAIRALRDAWTALAEKHPFAIVIDDGQWADLDSSELLIDLIRPPQSPRMLVLVASRSDLAPNAPLAAGLDTLGRTSPELAARSIEVSSLSHAEVGELARGLLGDRFERFATTGMWTRDGIGSPLLVEQIAEALRKSDPEEIGPDPDLESVLAMRVAHLAESEKRLLELVALSGVPLEARHALDAAGVDRDRREALARLDHEGWLRRGASGTRGFEIHHDRLREAVLGGLSGEHIAERHRALLGVLRGVSAPHALLPHAEGAGEFEEASRLARRAGEEAAAGLAFDRAANLFARALELAAWSEQERLEILRARADALVGSGRGQEAAPLYLACATESGAAGFDEMHRMAADQYMVSGRRREGIGVLRPLLSRAGLRYPESPARAVASLLGHLALLVLWDLPRFDRRDPDGEWGGRDPGARICLSAARGLVMSDTLRGSYFALLGLRRALAARDRVGVATLAPIVGGAVLGPFGGPFSGLSDSLIARAEALGRQISDSYPGAAAVVARSQLHVLRGEWELAPQAGESALAALRQGTHGVQWERSLVHTAILRSLEELGRFSECERLAADLFAESEALGDRTDGPSRVTTRPTCSSPPAAPSWPASARCWRSTAKPRVPSPCSASTGIDLEIRRLAYVGQTIEALQLLDSVWPQIQAAQFLRVPMTRVDAHLLRARTALLALGEGKRVDARRLEADVARLERERRTDARAHAALLRGGLATLEDRAEAREAHLVAAESTYGEAGMASMQALVSRGPTRGTGRWPRIHRRPGALAAGRRAGDQSIHRWLT